MSIKIASFNCRGLKDNFKRRDIFNWLKKSKYDLILIQETHSGLRVENRWKAEWGCDVYFSHGTNNSRGVAILLRNTFQYKVKCVKVDDDGRICLLKITFDERDYIVASIYGPNVDDPNFFCKLFDMVESLKLMR